MTTVSLKKSFLIKQHKLRCITSFRTLPSTNLFCPELNKHKENNQSAMTGCCALHCANQSEKKRMFRFPRSPTRRKVWESRCRRPGWKSNRNSRLCEEHFEQDQYEQHRADGRRLLKPFAVPTIFDFDVKSQKQKRKRKRADLLPAASPFAMDHTYQTGVEDIDNDPATKTRFVSRNSRFPSESQASDDIEFWNVRPNTIFCQREDSFREMLRDPIARIEPEVLLTELDDPAEEKLVEKLQAKVKELEAELQRTKAALKKANAVKKAVNEIPTDLNQLYPLAEAENKTAKFLIDQANHLLKKNQQKWSEFCLGISLRWQLTSPAGYNFVKKNHLLQLPSKRTLKDYVALLDGEMIMSTKMKHKINRASKLFKIKPVTSMIFEEIVLSENSSKAISYFIGKESETWNEKILLNVRLSGVISRIIPVGYFFVDSTKKQDILSIFIPHLVKTVEEQGFAVAKIIGPPSETFQNIFESLRDISEAPTPKVPHPCGSHRTLFLTYYVSHIARQVYSDFLQKDFVHNQRLISARFLKALQILQQENNADFCLLELDPVEIVNKKQIEDAPADKLFSKRIVTTISKLMASGYAQFQQAQATIYFIDKFRRWLEVHQRMDEGFSFLDEGTCHWLLDDFCIYLDEVHEQSAEKDMEFLDEKLKRMLKFTSESTALFSRELRLMMECG